MTLTPTTGKKFKNQKVTKYLGEIMKVVYNDKLGFFEISQEAENWLVNHGINGYPLCGMRYGENHKLRSHPIFVECIETLKEKSNTRYSNLKVKEIVGDRYFISQVDGKETVYDETNFPWVEGDV